MSGSFAEPGGSGDGSNTINLLEDSEISNIIGSFEPLKERVIYILYCWHKMLESLLHLQVEDQQLHQVGGENIDELDQLLPPLVGPIDSDSDFVNFPTRDIRTRAPTPPPLHQVSNPLETIWTTYGKTTTIHSLPTTHCSSPGFRPSTTATWRGSR